ncbi:rhamnan synthesis F family protein [Stenotrophomonas sp. 24(2023)]|uniref:rhamnan synthesis F family protein n=1 Tax=Stenotrophomonas sp. 24(2023) TaxID=3068324 RepID=UPI0027E0B819|nr:rhamnan synthesis F family protein [Stenotrophomonas sp. 24(2023)]WMJ67730.1 rhamnan synthesis F family protein [Stenotrophomonas sp. 24(2023)]
MKAVRRVAVVAHFDAEGRLTRFTRDLLDGLLQHAERIVLVSTRLSPDAAESLDARITVIIRENVGYDFYSFRTGVLAVEGLYSYDELIIANDSVLMIDPAGLDRAFAKMRNVDCGVWGMTESRQVSRHLQSYFLVFRRNVFFSQYFHQFWRDVRVLDDKWEIILSYEIGLTQWLLHHGVRIASAFEPDAQGMRKLTARLKRKRERDAAPARVGPPGKFDIQQANPVHYLWDDLYRQFGFIKTEVLRDDPNGVADVGLSNLIDDPAMLARVEEEVARMRSTRSTAMPLVTTRGDAPTQDELQRYGVTAIRADSLKARFAIVLHLYHMDLIGAIHGYMRNMIVDHDLFVSVKSVADRRVAVRFFQERNVRAFVYVHPNIGRDVGPFVSLLNTGLLDRYDAVCKLHSKKSVYHGAGGQWRDDLMKSLLGSSHTVLKILQAFTHEPGCGIVGPERAYVSNARFWGGNEERLRRLAAETGIEDACIRLGFFAGTMFWFRPAALNALRERAISLGEFDPEAGQLDATLAHVIERLFVLWIEQAGYFAGTTRAPGERLCHDDYEDQGIAVLPP